jgi:hypothetical protein
MYIYIYNHAYQIKNPWPKLRLIILAGDQETVTANRHWLYLWSFVKKLPFNQFVDKAVLLYDSAKDCRCFFRMMIRIWWRFIFVM